MLSFSLLKDFNLQSHLKNVMCISCKKLTIMSTIKVKWLYFKTLLYFLELSYYENKCHV